MEFLIQLMFLLITSPLGAVCIHYYITNLRVCQMIYGISVMRALVFKSPRFHQQKKPPVWVAFLLANDYNFGTKLYKI